MAVDVLPLSTVVDCLNVEGGIQYSWYVDRAYITSATVVSGAITNFVMSTTGKWQKLEYDLDGTSFFNQTGQRNGKRVAYQAAAFLKFTGYTQNHIDVGNAAATGCQLVFIHVLTSGVRVVQGLEVDAAATGGVTGTKVRNTVVTPNLLSDTSENEARLEFNVEGQSRKLAPLTTLTDTAIAAL